VRDDRDIIADMPKAARKLGGVAESLLFTFAMRVSAYTWKGVKVSEWSLTRIELLLRRVGGHTAFYPCGET